MIFISIILWVIGGVCSLFTYIAISGQRISTIIKPKGCLSNPWEVSFIGFVFMLSWLYVSFGLVWFVGLRLQFLFKLIAKYFVIIENKILGD